MSKLKIANLALALALAVSLLVACGGSAAPPEPECTQTAEACAYLDYLRAHVHGGVVDPDARQGVGQGEAGAPAEASAQP